MKSLGVLGAAALVMTIGAANAAERRGLDAHEHGHGALNIAIEGQTVAMELEVPGADIVGFEHPAESAADRAKIDAAVAVLAEPQKLFLFPTAAECVVAQVDVALVGEDEAHHGEAHADDHEAEAHTEFHAEYTLTCAAPSRLDRIDFVYFEAFPNAEEPEVQLITDRGSRGFEVERDTPSLDLSGMT